MPQYVPCLKTVYKYSRIPSMLPHSLVLPVWTEANYVVITVLRNCVQIAKIWARGWFFNVFITQLNLRHSSVAGLNHVAEQVPVLSMVYKHHRYSQDFG